MKDEQNMKSEFNKIVKIYKSSYFDSLEKKDSDQLKRLLKNSHLKKVYSELHDHELLNSALGASEFTHYSAYNDFLDRTRDRHSMRRVMFYHKIGAAIAVAAIIILASFLWIETPEVKKSCVASSRQIVAGEPRAELTLGSGKVVILNQTFETEIEDLGEVKIQCDNGALNYTMQPGSQIPIFNELKVPFAGEFQLILNDSTKVWVNSKTVLRYPQVFCGDERRVYLCGEAYFDVKPGTKPFVVQTALGDIKVMGTSFSVKAYEQENMITTLVTGRVIYIGADSMTLNPNEQIVVNSEGSIVKRNVDVLEYIGWITGNNVFDNRQLGDIMRDLERWYDIKIEFFDPALKLKTFTGNLKRYETINTFLDILQSTGEVNYFITEEKIILY